MPYDNAMNRAVKRDVNMINKRYIAHTDMNGNTNAINYVNPAIEPQGQVLSGMGHPGRIVGGGVGCADFHRSSASKHYDEDKDGLSGSAILGLQDGTLAGDILNPSLEFVNSKQNPTLIINKGLVRLVILFLLTSVYLTKIFRLLTFAKDTLRKTIVLWKLNPLRLLVP